MPHVSLWVRVWGVNMMIPGPIDAAALLYGGPIGLYAYNVFALGVFVSGDIGMWDEVGHRSDLEIQSFESSSMVIGGFCDPDDPPWWC